MADAPAFSLSAPGGGEGWGEVGIPSPLAHLTLPSLARWAPPSPPLRAERDKKMIAPVFVRLDAIPPLSPEERQLLESVKALARDEIAPRAAGYDRSGEFPWDNV